MNSPSSIAVVGIPPLREAGPGVVFKARERLRLFHFGSSFGPFGFGGNVRPLESFGGSIGPLGFGGSVRLLESFGGSVGPLEQKRADYTDSNPIHPRFRHKNGQMG
ncbi:hypothetical protein ACS8E6_12285 [Salinicola halophyticus]|uniref:hypothetical protein n=1 Tax=Salinicola halophyticus TaxID=1808881 RepID=UPI003F479E94